MNTSPNSEVVIHYLDELSRGEIEELQRVGVCMDDWDYVLLVPAGSFVRVIDEDHDEICLAHINFYVDRLIHLSTYHEWYEVEFRGDLRGVGVAYHA